MESFRQQTSLPISVVDTGCMGLCSVGPNVRVMPDGTSYCRVKSENVPTVVTQHLEGDRPVQDLFHPRMYGYAHLAQPPSASAQPPSTDGQDG
ncbi:MAG: (2Fe-2S) ferredoxin domain-containing protein [Cyanobacteria bacterium P01_A01_bin.135]